MPKSSWFWHLSEFCVIPSIAPALSGDNDIYLVFDDFGERLGRAWRETAEERADWKTVITDLLDGQYSDPIRIVAFNAAEGWSRDVSEEIADEIAQRAASWMVSKCHRFWKDLLSGIEAAGQDNCRCR